MEREYAWFSEEGMRPALERIITRFWSKMEGTVADHMPMYLHDCSFTEKTLTVRIPLDRWMADRTGNMSNGAISVAMDHTMGFFSLYLAQEHMPPTITMQMSLLHPIPLDRTLYIRSRLLSMTGNKADLYSIAWLDGEEDRLVCTAVGMYYIPTVP